VLFHPGPRFWAVEEVDAIDALLTGRTDRTGGVDVLVLNREIDGGPAPAAVLRTSGGQRIIYIRSGVR
jgi:hypothetical protein